MSRVFREFPIDESTESMASNGRGSGLRWVGIDEAGYGPNLGPLVMSAVVVESNGENPSRRRVEPRRLDFWGDLALTVDRAGGNPERLWVDDSKAVFQGRKGRDRLEHACVAALLAAGHPPPSSLVNVFSAIGAGTLEETELARWIEPDQHLPAFPSVTRSQLDQLSDRRCLRPLEAQWSVTAVRTVILGPARFNTELAARGLKSEVHFSAFSELLLWIWNLASDGLSTFVTSDKHGGKHYYLPALCAAIPEAWIDRGDEGADLSWYRIRAGARSLELRLEPRADRTDGLVALASIISKAVRELWMDVFNGYWCGRLDGLRPTAGYHTDASRFRREIEALALAENCDPVVWWRNK